MKRLLITVIILFFLIPPHSFSDSSEQINLALDIGRIIDDYEVYFKEIMPSDDQNSKKKQIINELLTDIDEIKKDKQDMIIFNSIGNYEKADILARNIIHLSDKIIAYGCMYRLEEEKQTSYSYLLPLQFRGSELANNITKSIKKSEFIIGDYEIILDGNYQQYYESYADYNEECSNLKTEMLRNNAAARESIGHGIIGFIQNLGIIGQILLLGVTIPFLIYLITYWLGISKAKIKDKYFSGAFILISIFWFFFFPSNTGEHLFIRIFGVVLYGFVTGLLLWWFYLEILKKSPIYLKIKKPKKVTSLSKLEVSEDYEEILEDNGISCLEDLSKAEVSDLSTETHLQIETLIKLKEKAKGILKRK